MQANWREQAACWKNEELAPLFFSNYQEDIEQVKAVCHTRCSVRRECLSEALALNLAGTWGGMTEEERQRLRRRRLAS